MTRYISSEHIFFVSIERGRIYSPNYLQYSMFVFQVEALVLTRFGKETYRIFRLLIKNGHPFETDRVMTYST